MTREVIEVLHAGAGMSIQDFGRAGLKRYGVPPGGAMDRHAAAWANRLAGNADDSPVLEILLHGVRLRVLQRCRIAVTGATGGRMAWRAERFAEGDEIVFPPSGAGLWSYLAVEGGIVAKRFFGSASAYPRGGLGEALLAGSRFFAGADKTVDGIAGSFVAEDERRDYASPPEFRVWPGPQWEEFSAGSRERFFMSSWQVSSRSDRTGYRLEGARIEEDFPEMTSEPVLVGSVQVPPGGQPIVIMRDGPTVGGYAKIGLIDPPQIDWLAQCRPGVTIRFRPAT